MLPVDHAVNHLLLSEPHLGDEAKVVHRHHPVIVDDEGSSVRNVFKTEPFLAMINLDNNDG